jgi:hypothetical protein
MEPTVSFVVGSLTLMTLIVAIIAVAFPTAVHADTQWCVNGDPPCFYEELDCKKTIDGTEGAKCVKENLPNN